MAKKVLRSAEKFSEPFPPLSVTPLPLCKFLDNYVIISNSTVDLLSVVLRLSQARKQVLRRAS